jgi:hypothetical protein
VTLMLSLSPATEADLRRQASASGQDPAKYAADILEYAVRNHIGTLGEISDDERRRLQEAARELLRRSEEIAGTLKGPTITDFKQSMDEIMLEKARKRGLAL